MLTVESTEVLIRLSARALRATLDILSPNAADKLQPTFAPLTLAERTLFATQDMTTADETDLCAPAQLDTSETLWYDADVESVLLTLSAHSVEFALTSIASTLAETLAESMPSAQLTTELPFAGVLPDTEVIPSVSATWRLSGPSERPTMLQPFQKTPQRSMWNPSKTKKSKCLRKPNNFIS